MALRADKSLVLLPGAVLSTLSGWFPLRRGPGPAETPAVVEARHIPDFFLTEFDLTSMDIAGAPRYRLQAQAMTHYADDDTADIALPRMTVFRGNASPWQARAGQGWVAGEGEMVKLMEDVVIERPASAAAQGLEIRSDEMRVWPAREYAETERPVFLRSALGVTRAVGLHADFKHDVVELRAEVRGEYAAP
ncbi:MAG: LPS export ABC transporter periplasmic protein LptC [Pseudomonadota bacterium]